MNVPVLRFKEFEKPWEISILGEILKERTEITNEDIPIYSLTIENGVTPKTDRYEREHLVADKDSAYKLVMQNDFAFNPMNLRFGAIGKHSEKHSVKISKYYNIFYCKPCANHSFFDAYFRTPKMISFYDKMSSGSLAEKKRVHFSDFLKFQIPIPTYQEQTKIANFLTAVDEKITQLTQKSDLLAQYKKSLMRQIFNQKLRFKDDDGSEFSEWKNSTIGEMITQKSGKYNPEKSTEDFNCIELEHLSQETGALLGYTSARLQKSIKNKFQKGNILFGKLRPYLKKFLKAPFDGVCSTEIWVLTGKSVSNDYVYQFVQTEQFITLTNISSGSKMPRADWDLVASERALYPEPKEQIKIANFLSSIDDKITQTQTELDAVKQYKQGLLQQMFV